MPLPLILSLLLAAQATPDPAWRAPDPWTLRLQRLQPRALFEQLEEQPYRKLRGGEYAAAADGVASGTLPLEGELPEWHGYYTLDGRAAARLAEGLDLNVEWVAYQRSASSGYHKGSEIVPGFSAHWYGEVLDLSGAPVWGDLAALDLGEVTIGHGVLLERAYSQGVISRLAWRGWSLEHLIVGQATYLSDDLVSTRIGWRQIVTLDWIVWNQPLIDRAPHYLSLSGALPGLGPRWRIAWEAAARLPEGGDGLKGAGLLRVDWLTRGLHVGYQARVYQKGVGPWGDQLTLMAHAEAAPWREDTYVTNAADYLPLSAVYHQSSHTLMLEAHAALSARASLELELEARAWLFDDPSDQPHRIPRPVGLDADKPPLPPDPQLDLHARLWLVIRPLRGLPHALRAGLTNTALRASNPYEDPELTTETSSRLDRRGWLLNLEMEVFL